MNNRTMLPTLRHNAAAGNQGPVKIESLKGAGLLHFAWVQIVLRPDSSSPSNFRCIFTVTG